ncbi:MAG: hypothetical protein ACJAXX_002688 [Roseivirga sp.]|jgi:hypothetical protein
MLYLLLAPLFFFSFYKRGLGVLNAYKNGRMDNFKINVILMCLMICVLAFIVFMIEWRI